MTKTFFFLFALWLAALAPAQDFAGGGVTRQRSADPSVTRALPWMGEAAEGPRVLVAAPPPTVGVTRWGADWGVTVCVVDPEPVRYLAAVNDRLQLLPPAAAGAASVCGPALRLPPDSAPFSVRVYPEPR